MRHPLVRALRRAGWDSAARQADVLLRPGVVRVDVPTSHGPLTVDLEEGEVRLGRELVCTEARTVMRCPGGRGEHNRRERKVTVAARVPAVVRQRLEEVGRATNRSTSEVTSDVLSAWASRWSP